MIRKFISFLIFALAIVACAKHRSLPLSIQCDDDIKLASKHLKATGDEQDKDVRKKIENLIQAAKIQQQHEMYASCIDKAQRALTLLKVDQNTEK
jgi:hypothetical protein